MTPERVPNRPGSLPCERCGETFTVANAKGRLPSYCDGCKIIRRREARARWVENNPAAAKAAQDRYNAAHRAETNERVARWFRENPERKRTQEAAWRSANPGWAAAQSRAYRERNPEKVRIAKRRAHLGQYGLTPDQYYAMFDAQGGVCGICRGECPTGKNLAVDHCHESDVVRGLLCANCNRALGLFKDRPDVLRAAADYLEQHKT